MRARFHCLVWLGAAPAGARPRVADAILQNLPPCIRRLRRGLERGLVRVAIWVGGVVGIVGGKCAPGFDDRPWIGQLPLARQGMRCDVCLAVGMIFWRRTTNGVAHEPSAWRFSGWTR